MKDERKNFVKNKFLWWYEFIAKQPEQLSLLQMFLSVMDHLEKMSNRFVVNVILATFHEV